MIDDIDGIQLEKIRRSGIFIWNKKNSRKPMSKIVGFFLSKESRAKSA